MQIPSDYMVLASAQSFLQKEAEIFAKDNEQPLQLVTAAFMWKMHRVKDTEQTVPFTAVEEIVDEGTLEEFWNHRESPEGPTNGQKWVHKLCSEQDRQIIQEALAARKVESNLHLVMTAQTKLMKNNPPNPKWISDVTYTPTMLEQRRAKIMSEVEAPLNLPKPGTEKPKPAKEEKPREPAIQLGNKIEVRRAEPRDADEFLTFTPRGGKMLLLKRLDQEFYYAILRTPQGRTLLNYGSYSRNPYKQEHTFKSKGDIVLSDTLVTSKLADKWDQYPDRLMIESDSYEDLKQVWGALATAVPDIMPTVRNEPAAPKPEVAAVAPVAIDPSPF